ncbi:MAG: hypothetical protein LBD42_04495 [Desulfovibrio sp.]|jgi:hypothetical protein|nr:hypothetical protein [Desulfovibrio sp.]
MKRQPALIVLGMLILTVLPGLLTACSRSRPLATNPSLHTQEKLQAVDHWDNIADTVAMRVQKSLEDRRDLINKPIYIQPPNDRAFSMAFYDLLRTRLVSRGMQVSDKREADSLMLNYSVQTVLHDSSANWTPSLAALGIAVVNSVTGSFTTRSDHEIIINSDMVYKNRYVMHLSTVCYIDDKEWPMYISPESFDPNGAQTRTVRLVDR